MKVDELLGASEEDAKDRVRASRYCFKGMRRM